MEFSVFIPLMVAAIQSAGQVLSAFPSKAKEAASKYIFDREYFEDTIVESSEQLADLVSLGFLNLKQEIIELSILEVVEDLQANISSLGDLLKLAKTSEITPALAEQLVSGGLYPLKKSLNKAETRLTKYGRDDMRLFCHVVGTNTLIAGFIYLGENNKVPTLQKDLEDSIYVFQKRLLDSIARSNREVPWNKVPYLLTTEGVSELVELYNSTLQSNDKRLPLESPSTAPKNPSEKRTPSPKVKKRKVRDMKLQGIGETARRLHGFFPLLFTCSECGFSVHKYDLICPNCGRKFLEDKQEF
jgi:hypothetical protein